MHTGSQRPFKYVAAFCTAFLVAGCLSGPFASEEMDAAAKTFTPADNRANVYVIRDAEWPGYQGQVLIDNMVAGWIVSSSYTLLSVSPGAHVLCYVIFDHTARANIWVDAGKSYFFQTSATQGWNEPTVELKPADESSGKALVSQSRRAVNNP